MRLLQDVEKAGSDIDTYVSTLDEILLQKIHSIHSLRENLLVFKDHLKQEELLSKIIAGQNTEEMPGVGIKIEEEFGLGHGVKMEGDIQLLDDLGNF